MAAMATRMIGRGQIDTRAAQLATLGDLLRARAYATTPRCAALANGGPVTAAITSPCPGPLTVPASGIGRDVGISASYNTPHGACPQGLTSFIEC